MTEPPIARVLADEVLWYSQRDGWGHLHRYDLRTGALLGQVTSGQWAVRQILQVDEAERVAYFTASGLVEEDPYVAHGVPSRSGRLRLRQGHRPSWTTW
jgi:hypothetical protein